MTRQHLARTVGVSPGYISKIERGLANPSIALVERIATALELELDLVARSPVIIGGDRQRDLVHARCSGHVDRRLHASSWLTAREVEITQGRSHGWIDLLAFDPKTGTLAVIEIKTRLDDIGAIERQLGWYRRSAFDAARSLGWQPRRVVSWLLALASDEVEDVLRSNRDLMAAAFPVRARAMAALVEHGDRPVAGHGLALIDPVRKRHAWLILSQVDGRRSPAPYAGYADAARRIAAEVRS
jgi:transcriptional regulator with XRE-family HTH domain